MFCCYVLPGQQGKKHVSGVACLKLWSARAWRRQESERMFREATSAIRSGVCHNGMASFARGGSLPAREEACVRSSWFEAWVDQRRPTVNPACCEGHVSRSNIADPVWYGFTTAWHGSRTACVKAGGGSFGQLERCSSECQSVAQTDQRRPTVNPACLEGHV